jgi:putative endonuclease
VSLAAAETVTRHARGVAAEQVAAGLLERDGFTILARRVRLAPGEIDLVASRAGLLAFVEVKTRPSLAEAALSLSPRQRQRLLAAAEAWMAANPGHGAAGVRFDVILVDRAGQARRVRDAFRLEN